MVTTRSRMLIVMLIRLHAIWQPQRQWKYGRRVQRNCICLERQSCSEPALPSQGRCLRRFLAISLELSQRYDKAAIASVSATHVQGCMCIFVRASSTPPLRTGSPKSLRSTARAAAPRDSVSTCIIYCGMIVDNVLQYDE